MSLSPRGFFGRKREPTHHQLRDPYQDHGFYGPSRGSTNHVTFPTREPSSPMLNSHVEWNETPAAHVYTARLPGLRRSDVRVEVDEGRVLSIVCEKSVEKQEQRGGWHLVEMSSGQFVNRFLLPENSNPEHVRAHMDKGVLTITVPKHNRAANHHVRSINISEN